MKKVLLLTLASFSPIPLLAAPANTNEAAPHHRRTTIEKERPKLDETTKALIAAYRRDSSEKNRTALRKQVEINYDKVIARKQAKLRELKQTARHSHKIREMEAIVDEVVRDRKNRIEQSMRRFTDPRLGPDSRRSRDGFLPLIGAAQNVSIAYTPVTCEEYAAFIKESGRKAPQYWPEGKIPAGKNRHPVTMVSFYDAQAYCAWLSARSNAQHYRLPTAEEWELAAGHMPKDAEFNCGESSTTSSVDTYARTLSACGAIDMWGNCREWTASPLNKHPSVKAVKGGSFRSSRMHCRTEYRDAGMPPSKLEDDLGFRIVRED